MCMVRSSPSPPLSLAHAYIHNFLPTTAASTASYFITSSICVKKITTLICVKTSLICVKKGKFRRMAPGRKSFPAKDRSYCSSESPNCCLHCRSQNVSPRASSHALAFCTGMTTLPIPSRLVFIILDRISMCLVKKRLTMQRILSTQRAKLRMEKRLV